MDTQNEPNNTLLLLMNSFFLLIGNHILLGVPVQEVKQGKYDFL
jgi:hypothetical protein